MNLYQELEQLKADLNRIVVRAHGAARLAGRMEAGKLQNVPDRALVLNYVDHTAIRNYAERLLNYKDTEGQFFTSVVMRALEQLEKLQKERAELQASIGTLSRYINSTEEAGK